MKIAILGTGTVGNTLGTHLAKKGHQVKMGSRDAANPKAREWATQTGSNASTGTFAEAAAFGEVIFNCTAGEHSLAALKLAGAQSLTGKVLIDLANPLDFSKGMPPSLFVSNTDSLGEQIQRAFPGTRVVKTLNTVNHELMINPARLAEETDMFMCGNDAAAKQQVATWLRDWFGWKRVVDVGDITCARGTEAMLPIWIRLWGVLKTPHFNFRIVREPGK